MNTIKLFMWGYQHHFQTSIEFAAESIFAYLEFIFENQRNELERIFGKDVILDFEGLLIGRIGMNIRNKLAHGLLSYDECFFPPRGLSLGFDT